MTRSRHHNPDNSAPPPKVQAHIPSPPPSWSAWFSFQYDLREDVTALIQERTKGRSDAFKTAVYSALIETLAENMRLFITLPDPAQIDGSQEGRTDG